MPPHTPLVLGTHRVAIVCPDGRRSKRFYVEAFGLEVAEVYREARRTHKLDPKLPAGPRVELFHFPDPSPRPNHPAACGPRHLALAAADLDAAVAPRTARGHGRAGAG
jgi:glyoxylase I family protein